VQNVFTAFSPILVFSRTLSSDIYSSADPVPNDSNAKLMNVFWRDINRGFVELNAKITVKQGLPDGAPIELHYSAKAKVADEDYFTQDFSKLFRVGQSACIENCDSSIGWVFEIQHDSERHAIMPGATEKLEKGYDYNLFYSIYNLTDSAFSSASLTVKITDTSLLSFFGHETENSFSVFSAVNIPANSVYSYGMTSPLSFNAKSETSFLDVNFVLSTTPKIKDGDDSNVSGLTFSIKSTNFLTLELPKSLPQNPSGITVIVKDQKTGALLDNAFVQVLPDALFPGTGARRALKVFGQAGTYYVQFESGFMPERFVSVKATVIGHKDAEKLVYVSGEAPDIISNYDYSCIKIDANTLKAEDQNAAFLLRGQSTNLVFRSANCPYASTVSLSVPSYLSDFVTINYSNGKNISLQRNDAAGIPVTIQVSQKAPIGKIPIFVDAKFSADVFLRRIKGVHLIVTDKTSCFAMLDRENFFGNQKLKH
jgi:hypothetical protein